MDALAEEPPLAVKELAKQRWELRREGKFNESDRLRELIAGRGYIIKDGANDYTLISMEGE